MIEINGVTSGVTGGGLVSEEKGDKMGEGGREDGARRVDGKRGYETLKDMGWSGLQQTPLPSVRG